MVPGASTPPLPSPPGHPGVPGGQLTAGFWYAFAMGFVRLGVGSNASHPYVGNCTSTQAWRSFVVTCHAPVLGSRSPGVYPSASRVGNPSVRSNMAMALANCWQKPRLVSVRNWRIVNESARAGTSVSYVKTESSLRWSWIARMRS